MQVERSEGFLEVGRFFLGSWRITVFYTLLWVSSKFHIAISRLMRKFLWPSLSCCWDLLASVYVCRCMRSIVKGVTFTVDSPGQNTFRTAEGHCLSGLHVFKTVLSASAGANHFSYEA